MTGWAIDLHMHSTYSDGGLPPSELVRRAAAARVAVIALTDHDTVAGFPEAAAAGHAAGVRVIPAVELSAQAAQGTCHILGYDIDPANAALREHLRRQRAGREQWLGQVLGRLGMMGLDITAAEVRRECSHPDFIGRPHLAWAMVRKRIVPNFREAFARYLGDQAPAFLEKEMPAPAQVIALIRQAGGLATLAHPGTLTCDKEALERAVAGMVEAGLEGLEVQAAAHNRHWRRFYQSIAEQFGLLATGGSDFHWPENGRTLGIGADAKRLRIERFGPFLERVSCTPPGATGFLPQGT